MRTGEGILDTLLSLMCYGGYGWCAARFLGRQLHGTRREEGVFGGLLFFAAMITVWFMEGSRIPYILQAAGSHLMLAGLTLAVFRGEKEKKLLAAAVLAVMTALIWNFCDSLLSCAGLTAIRIIRGGRDVFMGAGGGRIIMAAVYGVGISSVILLSKPLCAVFADKPKNWYLYMAFPLVCILLVTDMANWAASNGIMVQDRGRLGLYADQLFSHGAMCIFTGLAAALSGSLVFGMDRIFKEEKIREQYRSQVMYYQMMEEQYSRMESLRHDMKNHLIVLENMVRSRQWNEAGSYVKEMAEAGNTGKGEEATGSAAVDALLFHKRQQAEERGILWKCDARLPGNCPVKEMDLCIITGNILDNAIEACKRLPKKPAPFIQIYIGTVKKCILIDVKNSTDLADKAKITGSRKENPADHGIGLSNVKAAAGRCSGAVHWEVKGGIFTISILLPLCGEEDSA